MPLKRDYKTNDMYCVLFNHNKAYLFLSLCMLESKTWLNIYQYNSVLFTTIYMLVGKLILAKCMVMNGHQWRKKCFMLIRVFYIYYCLPDSP